MKRNERRGESVKEVLKCRFCGGIINQKGVISHYVNHCLEYQSRYNDLLSHVVDLKTIQKGLIHDRDQAYNEIRILKEKVEDLKHGTC